MRKDGMILNEKPKVCIALTLEDDLKAQISAVCDVRVADVRAPQTELVEAIYDVEGILGTPRIRADSKFFDAAPKLRVLSTCSVGFDPIDVPEATRRGVVVCHTPGVLNAAVANLTLSMIFALALKLFENESYARSGGWARREKPPGLGRDIQGKTLGVIGFGRIGQEVTRRVQALGMRTLWSDVFDHPPEGAPESESRPLDALLAESDFVSLHTNLGPSSHHMIGAAELNRMKPGAFLINTARGPLVDQKALSRALETGQIAGAALDVLESEPPDPEDSIVRLPNVICFPHIGSATEETRRAMRELAVQNLLDVLAGKLPPAPVNPEVLA
ncbi:MAG: D-glycerate dehydrogenase [bacterium]|nr:D-glycerate dehydrogenase [bacterium]